MAGCTINEDQFIFAYGQTKKAIDQALENNDSYLSQLIMLKCQV